ncbi:MAG: transglycosylase SLT domain-containing protein [Legionellales bacterium]|jgi:soluble lytic murein transglycosylase
MRKKALLFCVLSFCSSMLFAQDLDALRKNFVYAEEAIKKGDLETYYELKPGLANYPLYPYLQYAEITRMMRHSLPSEHIEKFIKAYPNSSLAIRLQTNWLTTLAKQQQWALYKKFYEPSDDVSLQCYAVWADYKTTQKTSALSKATPLWLSAYSRPDACNSLFTAWQKTQYFNNDVAWQRTQLAMDANQTKLVTFLKRYLNTKQLAQVDNWFKLKEDYAAAINLATSHDPKAIDALDALIDEQIDTPIYEWRVRYALRQQDWPNVTRYIHEMPEDLQQQPTWRYWQGRALLAQNKPQEANPILEKLSKERNYHGMLASDLLGKPYSLNHAVYPVDTATKNFVAEDKGIQRAQELFILNRLGDARREWNTSTATFNEEQLQAAAQLARALNWYDRGILTATQAQDRNDLTIRFPLAYEKHIKSSSQKNNIDTSWAFAISRQESAFLPDAQSSASAMGVMQLLPSTAQLVAKETGKPFNKNQLVIPEHNISLGTIYLRDMLAKFNHRKELASAAYNAGASRVYRWLPEEQLPMDIWVETIPFKETRGYVQNVSSYWVIYNDHLGIEDKRLDHSKTYVEK